MAVRTLVLAALVVTPGNAEFLCGDAVTTSSGTEGHQIKLNQCDTQIDTFNANPVWSLWAANSQVLFGCQGDNLVSASCSDAVNHLFFVTVGTSSAFACDNDGSLATTNCDIDTGILNGFIGFVKSDAPSDAPSPAPSPAPSEVPTSEPTVGITTRPALVAETTTTDAPDVDREGENISSNSSSSSGKKGKVSKDSGSDLADDANTKLGKKKKNGGKKRAQFGFGISHQGGAIALVAGLSAGIVFAIATIWRAKKIARRDSELSSIGDEEADERLPLLSGLTVWAGGNKNSDASEYSTPSMIDSQPMGRPDNADVQPYEATA